MKIATACAIAATMVAGVTVHAGSSGCPGDLNGSGEVDAADLGVLLSQWGPCPGCAADLNGDDVVDGSDLGLMLGQWGPCPKRGPVITDVSPKKAGPGDILVISGSGFPQDSNDICTIAIDPKIGLASNASVPLRVIRSTETEVLAQVFGVPPGMTEGRVMLGVGDGGIAIPPGGNAFLGGAADVMSPGAWVWQPAEDPIPPAFSDTVVEFVDEGGVAAGCQWFWSTITMSGELRWEVSIPSGQCEVGTTLQMQVDAWLLGGGVSNVDWATPIMTNVPLTIAQCATVLCQTIQMALFNWTGQFWGCVSNVLPNGNIELIISAPIPQTFDPNCSWTHGLRICPPKQGTCCIATGTPAGCPLPACVQCICATDPFCCNVAWDQICADSACQQPCAPLCQ